MNKRLYYYGWQQLNADNQQQVYGVQIASDYYKTEAEAQELYALFTKGCKFRCGAIQGTFVDTPTELRFTDRRYHVSLNVSLWSNGINKGTNETGLNRLRRIKKEADRQGVEIIYRPLVSNAVEIEEFR